MNGGPNMLYTHFTQEVLGLQGIIITKVESNSKGPIILLSRIHYGFVKRLFELEIPEIKYLS